MWHLKKIYIGIFCMPVYNNPKFLFFMFKLLNSHFLPGHENQGYTYLLTYVGIQSKMNNYDNDTFTFDPTTPPTQLPKKLL